MENEYVNLYKLFKAVGFVNLEKFDERLSIRNIDFFYVNEVIQQFKQGTKYYIKYDIGVNEENIVCFEIDERIEDKKLLNNMKLLFDE